MAHEQLGSISPSVLSPAIVEAAERAQIGIVVTSGSGAGRAYEYVSPRVAEFLATTVVDLERQAPCAVFPDEHRAQVEAWRDRRLAGQPAPSAFETELLARTGARFPVRITASRARALDRDVLVEFLVDTHESRHTEALLSVSEARFRELIEVAPEGVAIGVATGLAYVNPAALGLLGYETPDELCGLPLGDHVHPEDRALAEQSISDTLASGSLAAPVTLRLRRRDRRYVDVEIVAMAIEWDAQRAVLTVARDLGERRQLQAQLVQADRLAAVGTLAAGVAHEINNPLAYVLLNLEYLLRELPKLEGDPTGLPRLIERLAEARHGAERVSSIVRDLRAFSREDRLERQPVDLRLVLSSAARVAASEVASRGRLIEDYRDTPAVRANAARLEQVFLNLLVNAAQALPPQGGGEVRIVLHSIGDRAVVEIADTGAGIPPELLDRVFDPFFSTKPIGTGTGLGLPICHSIVTSLDGDIVVHSELGRGTTFRVSLPALPRHEKIITPVPVSSPQTGGPRVRVLVVDDELPVASMLSRVLSDQHDVRIATSAREALALLLDESFDVVLCDLLMPGMSGMDLYRELAERRPGTEERLVFMTGGAFTPRAAEFLARVSNPRLEKPFDLSRMRRLVRELATRRD